MELSKQVCSLEQAKRLKELGVEQESLFYWTSDSQPDYYLRQGEITCDDDYSAFTVAELGVMLPIFYVSGKAQDNNYTCAHYQEATVSRKLRDVKSWPGRGKTEAESRAAMLIYLLENGDTTAEEVNKRLNQ